MTALPDAAPSTAKTLETRRFSTRRPLRSLLPRLTALYGDLKNRRLRRLIKDLDSQELTSYDVLNALMCVFRDTRSTEVFSLIYEISHRLFLSQAYRHLKRYGSLLDPYDVIQETYLSIYRYPRGFREEGPNAFRNWSHSIIRNAVFKHSKRMKRVQALGEMESDVPDPGGKRSPLDRLAEKEQRQAWGKLYVLSLWIYLYIYNTRLNAREKAALDQVEVKGKSYLEASRFLGIKTENFKMVVCRARKKILRASDEMEEKMLNAS